MHILRPFIVSAASFSIRGAALLTFCLAPITTTRAEMSAEELAKLAQNPIANLISVPFQNNTNFNYGPQDGTQNILNIQPVIPISVSKDWNLITRTIFPLIWQPDLSATQEATFGLGGTQLSAFLSPSDASSGWIWGVGAIARLPTHTDSTLGNNNWGLGPTAVALRLEKGNLWVYGMLVNNVWSLGTSNAPYYNNGLIQPFLNYNFKGGTYLTSAPIITVDWTADSGDQWTVSLGGGGRPHLSSWSAPCEHADRRLLQRCQAGQWRRLATACTSPVHVSEIGAA